MLMTTKKCLNCGKTFYPRTYKHSFCCKKCYRKHYWLSKEKNYPVFICPKCRERIKLSFDPKKKFRELETTVCPNCGYCKNDRAEEIPPKECMD